MKTNNIIGRYGLYGHDVSFIKRMGHVIKVTNLMSVRAPGLEDDRHFSIKNTVNDQKLEKQYRTRKNES